MLRSIKVYLHHTRFSVHGTWGHALGGHPHCYNSWAYYKMIQGECFPSQALVFFPNLRPYRCCQRSSPMRRTLLRVIAVIKQNKILSALELFRIVLMWLSSRLLRHVTYNSCDQCCPKWLEPQCYAFLVSSSCELSYNLTDFLCPDVRHRNCPVGN